jgi:hypothetical protein
MPKGPQHWLKCMTLELAVGLLVGFFIHVLFIGIVFGLLVGFGACYGPRLRRRM